MMQTTRRVLEAIEYTRGRGSTTALEVAGRNGATLVVQTFATEGWIRSRSVNPPKTIVLSQLPEKILGNPQALVFDNPVIHMMGMEAVQLSIELEKAQERIRELESKNNSLELSLQMVGFGRPR